MTVVDTQVT